MEEGLRPADLTAMLGVADSVIHGERNSTSEDDVMTYCRAERAKSTLRWLTPTRASSTCMMNGNWMICRRLGKSVKAMKENAEEVARKAWQPRRI